MGSFNPGASIWDIFSGILGAQAANNASNAEVNAGNNAISYENKGLATQTGNLSPYMQAGSSSISQLMRALQSGQFGAGSVPNAPTFQAPTLAQAQQTPGYEFTAQQGSKGILEGAAAAGGAISGGTLKSLDQYNSNLANTTYGNVYNQALQGYGANLSGYQANLGAQQQMYNQLFAPSQLGAQTAESLNSNIGQNSYNVGNLMTGIGNAQAAGYMGIFNNLNSGIGNFENSLPSMGFGGGGGGSSPTPGVSPSLYYSSANNYGEGPG